MNAGPNFAKNNLATFATFSDQVTDTPLGKLLYAEETGLINNKIIAGAGNPVIAFTVTEIKDKLFSNSSLKGQPYLIVFSATWCGPCQLELPRLKIICQV